MIRHAGTVSSFDEQIGLGRIIGDDAERAGEELVFHCIELADGSRTIEPGIDVTFDLLPRFGRMQAANIRRA